jgi:outer membrane lipoprotein SlyB
MPDKKQLPHVLAGVFGSIQDAEAAVTELRRTGVMAEDIGLAIPEPGAHPGFEAETTTIEELKSTATGMAIATPLGSLAGIALTAVVTPGIGVLSLGGLLFATVTGALWGAFFGAVGGFAARVRMGPDEDLWYEIPLKTGDILLVVHAREKAHEAHEIMHRHGVKCFVGETCAEAPA